MSLQLSLALMLWFFINVLFRTNEFNKSFFLLCNSISHFLSCLVRNLSLVFTAFWPSAVPENSGVWLVLQNCFSYNWPSFTGCPAFFQLNNQKEQCTLPQWNRPPDNKATFPETLVSYFRSMNEVHEIVEPTSNIFESCGLFTVCFCWLMNSHMWPYCGMATVEMRSRSVKPQLWHSFLALTHGSFKMTFLPWKLIYFLNTGGSD